MDVVIEELLAHIELLADELDAVGEVVDLEQKEDVLLLEIVVLLLDEGHQLLRDFGAVLADLPFVEHALQELVPDVHFRHILKIIIMYRELL